MDPDSLVKFIFDLRGMNAHFSCVVCDHKMNGVALKDSDMILCFVHIALLFWKVVLFTEESDVLSLGNAVTNCLVLTAARPWALADVRE